MFAAQFLEPKRFQKNGGIKCHATVAWHFIPPFSWNRFGSKNDIQNNLENEVKNRPAPRSCANDKTNNGHAMGPICAERKRLLLVTTAQPESRCSDINARAAPRAARLPSLGAKPRLTLLSSPWTSSSSAQPSSKSRSDREREEASQNEVQQKQYVR